MPGFRLGIYVFKAAEIIDFAAPYGVFSVARRFDPELDAFLIADSQRPVQTQAGFTVLPNYSFGDRPSLDAFLIPGGFGTRQEVYNQRLHEYIRALPGATLLTSVCTGSWVGAVRSPSRAARAWQLLMATTTATTTATGLIFGGFWRHVAAPSEYKSRAGGRIRTDGQLFTKQLLYH
jgi:putative intracellular protease/amidase